MINVDLEQKCSICFETAAENNAPIIAGYCSNVCNTPTHVECLAEHFSVNAKANDLSKCPGCKSNYNIIDAFALQQIFYKKYFDEFILSKINFFKESIKNCTIEEKIQSIIECVILYHNTLDFKYSTEQIKDNLTKNIKLSLDVNEQNECYNILIDNFLRGEKLYEGEHERIVLLRRLMLVRKYIKPMSKEMISIIDKIDGAVKIGIDKAIYRSNIKDIECEESLNESFQKTINKLHDLYYIALNHIEKIKNFYTLERESLSDTFLKDFYIIEDKQKIAKNYILKNKEILCEKNSNDIDIIYEKAKRSKVILLSKRNEFRKIVPIKYKQARVFVKRFTREFRIIKLLVYLPCQHNAYANNVYKGIMFIFNELEKILLKQRENLEVSLNEIGKLKNDIIDLQRDNYNAKHRAINKKIKLN